MSDTNRQRKTITTKNKNKSKRFTARLSHELQTQLDRMAEREDRSASAIVRLALRSYFKQTEVR